MKSKKNMPRPVFIHVANLIKLSPMYVFFIAIANLFCMQVNDLLPVKAYFVFAIGIILTYFIRFYVHKFAPYIILHILLLPCMLFFARSILFIGLTLLFCLLMCIYAYHHWCSAEVGVVLKLHPTLVIAIFIFYLISLSNGIEVYQSYFFLLTILYVLTSIISIYIIHMEAYLVENRENDSISLSKILFRNTRTGISLIVLLILLALIGNIPAVQEFVSQILNTLTDLLRKLMSSLTAGIDYSNKPIPTPSPEPSGDLLKNLDPGKPSLFAKILEYLIIAAFWCGIAAFAIVFLVKGIRYFLFGKRNYLRKDSLGDYDGIEEIRTKMVRKKKERKNSLRRKKPEDQIRYRYYKTITDYEKCGYEIKESHSPEERNKDIEKEYKDDISTLTKEYETVRYSNKQ